LPRAPTFALSLSPSLAGEVGLANSPRPGPGSLRVGLLDALHLMGEAEVVSGVKIRELSLAAAGV
jgi:hypothetical protein